MIKYEAIERKYSYNSNYLINIIDLLNKFYKNGIINLTKDDINDLLDKIDLFMNSIHSKEKKVIKERHETEEEAREYFGLDFIKEWNSLLTDLDQQQTIVSIHGTSTDICHKILENGLMYKSPQLTATTCGQSMNYGAGPMNYDSFEKLLNWGHRNYKGLVILAIPYECYYKEGLWNHFRTTEHSEYSYEYKIDSDFIVGYIDVIKKKIILNPKYNRHHDYSGYLKDMSIFKEKKDMDNALFIKKVIEANESFKNYDYSYSFKDDKDEEIEIEELYSIVDILMGLFNSIKNGHPIEISEDSYKYYLEELSCELKKIKKIMLLMDQIKETKYSSNDDLTILSSPSYDSDIWDDMVFEENNDWAK